MCDAFDEVALTVGEVVHGVDAPFLACTVVRRVVEDAIHHRISQVHIPGSHIDPGTQHARPIRELACSHAFEQVQVLFHRAVPVRAVHTLFSQCAAICTDFLCAEVIHICLAFLD